MRTITIVVGMSFWLVVGTAFAQAPSCDDMRDRALAESGQWQSAFATLNIEHRKLQQELAKVKAELEKVTKKDEPPKEEKK